MHGMDTRSPAPSLLPSQPHTLPWYHSHSEALCAAHPHAAEHSLQLHPFTAKQGNIYICAFLNSNYPKVR